MKIEYLLLNYFANNWFYLNGEGVEFNDRVESAINKLNNKDEIINLCKELLKWYELNKSAVDGFLKQNNISSKSLNGFSISYNSSSDARQTLLNWLPLPLFMELQVLNILELGYLATIYK